MKKSGKGKKIVIILCVLAVLGIAGFFLGRKFLGSGGAGTEEVAYVQSVGEYMGLGGFGTLNRYAGVVESQETWSVRQNPEYTVEEVFVSVGDEVKVGTPLFSYETDKFESDLTQAEIDLERAKNELESMETIKAQLEKEAKSASSSEQSNYTIRIQEQDLNIKQKEIDIKSKELEIEKLKDSIEHATVTSELAGIVQTVNNGRSADYGNGDDSFITVMQVGDFRVKGKINEQNIYDISEGVPVIVYSRAQKGKTWRGEITKIDTENAQSGQNQMYYGGGDSSTQSSSYPFYVTLDDSEGLILGQHVYMECDYGQNDEVNDAVRLTEMLIDMSDPAAPFVWAEKDGKLEKRPVTLGEYNEDMMEYEITSGLSLEDRIAFPAENLKEGMATDDMANFVPSEEDMGGSEDIEGLEGYEGEGIPEEFEGLDGDGAEAMEGGQG